MSIHHNPPTEQTVPPESREEFFLRLIGQGRPRLEAYLLSLLAHRQDAEDVLQQASLVMWRKFDEFLPGTDFLAWANKVAFYEARNFQRVSARSRLRFSDTLLETLAAERLADLPYVDRRVGALEHCIEQLDERNRELLEAVYQQDADVAALAARLGRAKQTLYNRLDHLRRMLAECIEKRLEELGEVPT